MMFVIIGLLIFALFGGWALWAFVFVGDEKFRRNVIRDEITTWRMLNSIGWWPYLLFLGAIFFGLMFMVLTHVK